MRKPIIAGNWKMHKSIKEGVAFVEAIKPDVANTDVEVLICAPYTLLQNMVEAAKGSNIKIGAQNMHFEDKGAFTGEVTADMLLEIGVTHVIIGHSERRQYYGETDQTVNLKTKKALAKGLVPVVCVGETLEQREAGETKDVCKTQIVNAFEGIDAKDVPTIVVAYEPIWAIGTGKTASSQDANDVIAYIREVLKDLYTDAVSEEVRIQYGGSVKPANVEEIMNESDIDGALVGGASLLEADFVQLVNF
ncbi:triose-phosphate isomerase [Fusibacter ferrireducens]|uniref:Triosephosphate isomerase n=1 Tax=Fusibacter ferrireducens TaxID=2785058 RepID=A0ABR9ZU53_9FIRM|nr:triose-phosphate isomerase [Fusibacter ferrireducens]MBF4694016.1 triose-phosphate isomerase [Fusibacter ferrireducens]